MQLLKTLLTTLLLVASTTAAPPTAYLPAAAASKRDKLIVVAPTVTSPSSGSKWVVGSNQVVTWDTSKIPPSGQNNRGTIFLGFNNGTNSENLDVAHPLASNFSITSGRQSVVVPKVPHKTTYFVVLVGDSGNKSPEFTISHS
ncbi:hypothetical protein B0F90DRAFT_1720025 [Multifurca ochricompacta]|uniref:Yeast cell wall synthesis Kre9/Knh1-like N-terminal domain-containing protein n=1 Tax=Multifurca ochricompacta TaxID=376703 RepID=A0AAD4M4B8_9AGAM|nr:hypothetical protein B0F90DRAFT_1720025 [Multifurca ochricompacta]